MTDPSSRLILALDVPTTDEAEQLIAKLGSAISFYKIGLELLFNNGLSLAQKLKSNGNRVFIDAKLLDIANTVESAVANIAKLGADFLTIHSHDEKTLEAANRGRSGSDLKLLGVTVLTSLNATDLKQQGTELSVEDLVIRRAQLAKESGIDGVVASGLEADKIRTELGSDLIIVTPGIRPPGADVADQMRVMTPERAIDAGADYLVIGRPITKAADPRKAAEEILQSMAIAKLNN